jgi:hypothetical protein
MSLHIPAHKFPPKTIADYIKQEVEPRKEELNIIIKDWPKQVFMPQQQATGEVVVPLNLGALVLRPNGSWYVKDIS